MVMSALPSSLSVPPYPIGAQEQSSGEPAFVLHRPRDLLLPLVFSSPHSGRCYPPDLIAASRLSPDRLRRSEDAYVEELFQGVVGFGAPLLAARFPRAYVDLNREPYELDPDLFEDALPAFANTRSLRVLGGLGTIARVVGDAEEIYRRRLTVAEAMARIETFYWPYHAALRDLIEAARQQFGYAILIDCHSMPSTSTCDGTPTHEPRAQFVLGDRFGSSCASDLTRLVEQRLIGMGFAVARNRPYAGGYITEHYGAPMRGVHALQLEINRALFTDEASVTLTDGFEPMRAAVMSLVAGLADYCGALQPLRIAAE
jgi:N-formylglutamate amidohydrolase